MSFFSLWLKVIFIAALVHPLYSGPSSTRRIKSNIDLGCDVFKDRLFICTKEMMPHCGTNERTYSNRCIFCSEMLKSNGSFAFKHYGQCLSTRNKHPHGIYYSKHILPGTPPPI